MEAHVALSVHPLDLGHAETDSSFLVWGRTPGHRVTAAVLGYVVLGGEHPIVVDTGYRPGRHERGMHTFTRGSGQTLAAALAPHGVQPEDVGLLVMTHLHSDHAGEIDALPEARIVVQRQELAYAAAPYFPETMYVREDIAKLVDPLFARVEPLDGDVELAPGVSVKHTGGHSPGHQQIEVELDSGLAIIAGDNAYLLDAFHEGVPPGYVTSIPDTMRAIADVQKRATHVLTMHDPGLLDRYAGGLR
jgi:N-acyl homoserine lactone hydrolase